MDDPPTAPCDDPVRYVLTKALPLVGRLSRAFPTLGEDRAEAAILAAVFDWWQRAPCNAGVLSTHWLYRAAWRNARDIVASDRRRTERERRWAAEAAHACCGSHEDRAQLGYEDCAEVCGAILCNLPDDRCRTFFRVWMRGEIRTEAYARAIGIQKLSEPRKRKEVKREKDRLVKHLRRNPVIRSLAARLLVQ